MYHIMIFYTLPGQYVIFVERVTEHRTFYCIQKYIIRPTAVVIRSCPRTIQLMQHTHDEVWYFHHVYAVFTSRGLSLLHLLTEILYSFLNFLNCATLPSINPPGLDHGI